MTSRWMMIDGKLNPHALSALYAPGMTEEVVALLQGTAYAPLAASGPLLARLESNSGLQAHWQSNEPPARHAWCFTSDLSLYPLIDHWRRRLLWRARWVGHYGCVTPMLVSWHAVSSMLFFLPSSGAP